MCSVCESGCEFGCVVRYVLWVLYGVWVCGVWGLFGMLRVWIYGVCACVSVCAGWLF